MQARASGENLNYVTLAPQERPSGEILNYLLSHYSDILYMIIGLRTLIILMSRASRDWWQRWTSLNHEPASLNNICVNIYNFGQRCEVDIFDVPCNLINVCTRKRFKKLLKYILFWMFYIFGIDLVLVLCSYIKWFHTKSHMSESHRQSISGGDQCFSLLIFFLHNQSVGVKSLDLV